MSFLDLFPWASVNKVSIFNAFKILLYQHTPDVIDGILCEEKKKEDRDVIITGAELEKFFGKEATPRQMKDQIMTLLEDWKERQPPELAKPDKKMDMEK